jgi:hypothetical protein
MAMIAATGCLPARGTGTRFLTRAEIAAIPSSFPVTIERSDDPQHRRIAAALVRGNVLEGMGTAISILFDLRQVQVPITLAECDGNASYDPHTRLIQVCYQLIDEFNELAGHAPGTVEADTRAMVQFALLHEIAHALIDAWALDAAGADEDRADQFAILVLTHVGERDLAARLVDAPVEFFHALRDDVHDPNDPHSSGGARAAEAECLLYGRLRDPALAPRLGEQAAPCVAHTRAIVDMWNRALATHTRAEGGRMF